MATYVTDEILFDLFDGYVDESINVFASGNPQHPLSIVIHRDPMEKTLDAEVQAQVDGILKGATRTKLVGRRNREVGNLPAREVKLTTYASKQHLYVRQTWVAYFGRLLSFTVSSPRAHQQLCDATADRLLESIKFRKGPDR